MDEITITTFYYASNKEEADKMKAALDKAREQATGKIRQFQLSRILRFFVIVILIG